MSDSLCVSLMTKKGVSSVVILREGKLAMKSVTPIKNKEILNSSYMCLLDTFITALRLVRKYTDNNKDITKVVFEVNNSTLIKWIYNNYSKEEYQELFIQAIELLNDIPIQYTFLCNKNPIASKYFADVETSVKLTGLLDIGGTDEC